MTLCLAWIRKTMNTEELVFATDSTLTGGEKWNHGVKLLELPRKDCLICFAGETYRAYPLILNLISAIRQNEKLQEQKADIQEVLYGIVEIFTDLVKSIFEKPTGSNLNIGGEAKFLFGGWSWIEQRFRVWRLQYSSDADGFIPTEQFIGGSLGQIAFLGDPEDDPSNNILGIEEVANNRFKQTLIDRSRFDGKLDMEPLQVLVEVSRDATIREVDGAIQIGKIYKSGTSEFLGVMWPSIKGVPTFLGQVYNQHNKPRVRYFDPDTCEIIEEQIPDSLNNIEEFASHNDYDFLKYCYNREGTFLKEVLTEKEKDRLIYIFREFSYNQFIKKAIKRPDLQILLIESTDAN